MNLFWQKSFFLHAGKSLTTLLMTLVLSAAATAQTIDEALEQAKNSLRDNDPETAYQALVPHEDEFTGSDTFDYLLGLSALDSGRPGEAIFSLQRLLIRKPDFAGARLELARAYFEVGDNELARVEFGKVLAENPPERARETVTNYLDAIDARARAYTTTLQYYVDFSAGFDDNPAAATADDQFLSFFLDDKNVEQSSVYAGATAGVLWTKPLTPETQLALNANLNHRTHPSAHYVDPTSVNASAMINWRRGANTASIGLTGMLFALDGSANKNDFGLVAGYSRFVNDKWSIDSFGRIGAMRYDDDLEVQDVDQWMAGGGISRTGEISKLSVGLFAAEDDAQETGSPFSSETVGVQLSSMWVQGFRSYSIQAMAIETEYDDPFFGINREDDLYSVSVGTTWDRFPAKDWSLTLKLTYSTKDSTVSLYEFDRLEAGITIRKIFE